MNLEERRGACREQPPSRPRRPQNSKAEQAPDRRLVVNQLALERLDDLVGMHPKIAQLRCGDQVIEQFRAALQLSEVVWMQNDRLDVLRAVALISHPCFLRQRVLSAVQQVVGQFRCADPDERAREHVCRIVNPGVNPGVPDQRGNDQQGH